MSRVVIALLTLLMIGARPAAADDSGSPHHGMEMCPVCHNEDMTLQRSKLETCTLCHSPTVHSGAAEHLNLEGARVTRALAGKKISLPLADDGKIWCGTCHLFHDPSLGEEWLSMGWIPPDTGLPQSVRNGVTTRWDTISAANGQSKVDASFATKGTRQLRMSVEDGALCKQCHEQIP